MTTKTYKQEDELPVFTDGGDDDGLPVFDVKKNVGGGSPIPLNGTGGDGLSTFSGGSNPFSYEQDPNRFIKPNYKQPAERENYAKKYEENQAAAANVDKYPGTLRYDMNIEAAERDKGEFITLQRDQTSLPHIAGISLGGNINVDRKQYIAEQKQLRDKVIQQNQSLKANADKALKDVKGNLERNVEYVTTNINDFTATSGEGDKIPDVNKINEYAKKKAAQNGVSDEGYYKNLLYNEAKASVAHKIIEPKVIEKFNENYKKKYGKTPEEETTEEAVKGFTKDEEIIGKAKIQVQAVNEEISKSAKEEVDALNVAVSQEAANIKEQYEANAKLVQDEDQAKELHGEATAAISKLNEDFLRQQNAINSKYNARYRRQTEEIAKAANAKIQQESQKYKYKRSPDLQKRIESEYRTAYSEVVKGNQEMLEKRDASLPAVVNFGRTFITSLGGAIKGLSSSMDFDTGKVFGDYLSGLSQHGSTELKNFSDFLDATKLSKSMGQLAGGMTPALVAAAGTTMATGGAGAPAVVSMLAGGVASWSAETAQMAGNMYEDKFAETGNAALAENAVKQTVDSQVLLMPLYAFDGLPFLGKSLKLAKNIPARILLGGTIELGTEYLQEYPQNLFEEAIRNDKPYMEGLKLSSLERAKNTFLNIAPTFLLGGGGQAVGVINEKRDNALAKSAAKAFALKSDFTKIAPDMQNQFIFDIMQRKGKSFTTAYVGALFSNGTIDEAQSAKLLSTIKLSEDVITNSEKYGLSPAIQKVYGSFALKRAEALSLAETENGPILKMAAEKNVRDIENDMVSIASGEKTDYTVVTLPNNEQYVLTQKEAEKAVDDIVFTESYANGDIKVQTYGKRSIVQERLDEIDAEKAKPKPEINPEEVITKAAEDGVFGSLGEMVTSGQITPKQAMLSLAMQKYGILGDGTESPTGGRDISMKTSLDVDDAVTKIFPNKESVIEAVKQEPSPSMETQAQPEGAAEGVAPSNLEKPSDEQQLKDINEGNVVTFTYDNENQVPEVFKDKISSKGETNGKPIVRVTVAKSLADYELAKQEQQTIPTDEKAEITKIPNETKPTSQQSAKSIEAGKEAEGGTSQTTAEEKPRVRVTAEQMESGQPPSEPPAVEEGVSDDDNLPERRFTKQMLRSEELSDASKDEIVKTINYVRQTNEMSIREANEVIQRVGLDEAQNLVMNDSELKPVIRVVLGQILIKKYNELADRADNEPEKYYYLDKTIQVANFVTEKLATEAGQSIQAFSLWSGLSPEGQLRAAGNDLGGPARDRLRRREGDINKIGDKFKKANEEAADEVTKSEEVKQTVKKQESERVSKAKDKVTKAKDKLKKLKDKYKRNKGGGLTLSSGGLTKEGLEYVGELAAAHIQIGEAKLEVVINEIIDHLKSIGAKVSEEVKKQVADSAEKELSKYDQKLLGSQSKDAGINFNQIVKEHYTVVDKAKKSLTQKFMDEMDMSQSNAEELYKKVQAAFDRVATRKKRNILYHEKARFEKINKTLKGAKTPEQKTVADDIIKYSNLGAFENTDLRDMLADKFGLGKLSPEQAAKIKELAEKIQKAPEGSPKRDATEDLLAYRAKLRGNDLMEVVQGVWYANILSGYKTHEKNVVSTFFNTVGEIGAEMAKDPKAIPYLMAGYINGVFRRGVVEAGHTLATGRSPIHIKKIETPAALERKEFIGGNINPGNWFKYITRLMVAEDVLSFQGLKEARARQLARREAQKAGYNTWTKKGWDKVNEILFHTKERMSEATLQAEEEGLKGVEKKRRVYELMEESRPLKMTEDAYGFAAHGTFNHESEGSLGALTNAVAQALDAVNVGGAKPLRFIVPFTRIITNVVNNSLDFTPVGLIRAARGVRGFRSFEDNQFTKGAFKELSKEERQRLIAKAAIGITLAATLQALHVAGTITITGAGPDDEKKKRQLEQEGWQEYSIKVGKKWYSYKYTPLIFVTGFLGNMNDAAEYATTEDEAAFGKRLELAGWRIGGQVADMTWVNSASTFLGALTEKTPDRVSDGVNKALSGTARGLIPFAGMVTQASQAAQNIFNMPQKQVTNSWQTLIQDIPIARNHLNDKINALGDPIVRDIDVLVSKETKDPVWKFLLDHKGWVAPVNRGTLIVIDKGTQLERPTTDDEYYEFSKLRGQKIKQGILDLQKNGYYFDVNKVTDADKMTEAQLNKVLSEIEEDATKETKAELFGEKEKDYENEAVKPVIDILNKYNK